MKTDLYKYNNGKWKKFPTSRCGKCNGIYYENHEQICVKLNNNIEETTMPIHKTSKGYYWGSKGPFPTREKAEEVQKAAYASGYKEPMNKSKDKKK